MMEDHRGTPRQEAKPSMESLPSAEELQAARDNLLQLRESLGFHYDVLPAPDRLIRFLDRAIELIPGDGEPSQEPYA